MFGCKNKPNNKLIELLVEVVFKFMVVSSNLYAYRTSSKSNIKNTFKQTISFENKKFISACTDELFAHSHMHETILGETSLLFRY